MINGLKTGKDKIAYILEKYPETRDNDELLWLAYLVLFKGLKKKIGVRAYKELKAIILDKETNSMESVTRLRRRFQEQGKWVGTKRKMRKEEQHRVREWAREKHENN